MVSDKGDLPPRHDVQPAGHTRTELAQELANRGEVIVYLRDGRVKEFHGYDCHFFVDRDVIYLENEDDNDEWILGTEIVSLEQH